MSSIVNPIHILNKAEIKFNTADLTGGEFFFPRALQIELISTIDYVLDIEDIVDLGSANRFWSHSSAKTPEAVM